MTRIYDVNKKRTKRLIDGLINTVMILTAFLLFSTTQAAAATVIYEAEDADLSGVIVATNHTGYTGTGFGDYANSSTDYIEWTVDAESAGTYVLNFRYALASGDRPLVISVNNAVVEASLSFPSTGSWIVWNMTADLIVTLNQGTNTIRATAANSTGANVDRLDVTTTTDLSITKDSNISGDILPGEIFTYTIVVENDAAAWGDATNVTVRDPLPTGVTYVAASAQKTYPLTTIVSQSNENTSSIDVPDNQCPTETTRIINVPNSFIISDLNVGLNMTHPWKGDMRLWVTSPTGIKVNLANRLGGSNNNWDALFDSDSGNNNASLDGDHDTASPFYNYVGQANESLNAFDGEEANGDWIISFCDDGRRDLGTFNHARLDFTGYTSGYITDPAHAPENIVTAADNITLKPGETLTMTFEVKAYDDLSTIPNIINTAYAAATEMTTEINASTSNTTLPITISYAHPELYGDTIEVNFGTATETGNLGFNIYGIKGKGKKKKWIKLNQELIPGALDSFEPQDYHASVEIPEGLKVKKIGIAGVDVNGKEDRHGPFKLGKESGEKTVAVQVNWKKVKAQVKQNRKVKKLAKKMTKRTLKKGLITLSVDKNALYRITHDDLLALDINLEGLKAKKIAITLKDEGVARHISGIDKRGKWTKESSIEFLGERPNNTDAIYVDANMYRLSLNKKQVVNSEEIDMLKTQVIIIDNNKRYGYTQPLDDPFYEAYFYTRNENDIKVYTSQFDMPLTPQSGTSKVTIETAVTTAGSHNMSVMLNGENIADAHYENKGVWTIEAEIDNTTLKESANELKFTLNGESDGLDIVVYDKLVINYNDGEEVASIRPNIQMSDNVTKKDIQVKKGTNYLIVSHPLFMNETLDNYVQVRQSEGWKIQVVNVEDIYTAYANGMAIPEAIQTYIKESSQRGVTHVQLVGSASYDYHDYLGKGSVSFIPSIYTLTNNYIQYTPCDACYVMGEDNLPSVAIGRWPVRTLEGFENVVNKTLSWRSSGQSSKKNALFIADEIDEGISFAKQSERLAKQMENNGWDSIERIYLDKVIDEEGSNAVAAAKESIAQEMLQGPAILSYNGHGSTSAWSKTGLLKASDIAQIDNAETASIALPLTCMATYADSPSISTMAHQLLVAGENGAVALYGASTLSKYSDNGKATEKVFDGLTKGETLGESVMHAKKLLGLKYNDVIKNGNLLGDVTLRMEE